MFCELVCYIQFFIFPKYQLLEGFLVSPLNAQQLLSCPSSWFPPEKRGREYFDEGCALAECSEHKVLLTRKGQNILKYHERWKKGKLCFERVMIQFIFPAMRNTKKRHIFWETTTHKQDAWKQGKTVGVLGTFTLTGEGVWSNKLQVSECGKNKGGKCPFVPALQT